MTVTSTANNTHSVAKDHTRRGIVDHHDDDDPHNTILPPKQEQEQQDKHNKHPQEQESSEHSCSQLDLSWLSESVMEAALNTHNLSLNDVHQFHESLKAAEEMGSMDHDTSERLHEKIQKKEQTLMEKLVAHETARVSRKLGIYQILKTHKTWEQVLYMADMHGQGAYISMKDFKGLSSKDVEESLKPFYAFLDDKAKDDNVRPIPLPFSKPEDAKYTKIDDQSRPMVEQKVAEKLCKAYRRLYVSLKDKNMGGYDDAFLSHLNDYTPEYLCDLLQVTLPEEEDPKQEEQEFVDAENENDDSDDDDGSKGKRKVKGVLVDEEEEDEMSG